MNNDCGCTKKIVDKIYIENSCCKNKELSTCNNTSCTKCGKLIDLIDSDLYAENIYNYQGNTTFDSNKVILLESEMLDSRTNLSYKDNIYNILSSTNYKTELLIQLKLINGLYGLNCVASLRKIDSKYIVIYIKLYTDDTILDSIHGKTNNIKSILSIYTNDSIEATYDTIDITSYTWQEILSLLENYVTSEDLNQLELNLIAYIQNNYYNKEYIDNLNFGEDCLFELNESGEGSTLRKGQGNATGKKSFAIQGGTASGENSIAIEEGIANGKNTLAGIKSGLSNNNSSIDLKSESCISLIGGNIQESKDSIAISGGSVIKSELSASLLGGRCLSKNSISIGNDSVSGKSENFNSTTGEEISNNISLNGGTACGRYSIALGGPKDTGTKFGCIACGRGSTAIGDSVYSGGKYSFVFGQESEVGRYIKLGETLPTLVGDQESQESISLGYLNTVTGKFSSAIGERNFLKLSESSSSIGCGNAISTGKGNFAFGERNYIEGFHNVVGGLYSRIIPNIIKNNNNEIKIETFGSIAIGEPFDFLELFLYTSTNEDDSNLEPEYTLYYKLNNSYLAVSKNSRLGRIIESSNMILRNGKVQYLGTINFNSYNNSQKIYPGIKSYGTTPNGYVKFTLNTRANKCNANKNNDGYYQCSIKFSGASDSVIGGCGSVAAGVGNTSYGKGTTSFGIKNISQNDGEFSCGKYNFSDSNTLFTIGNGSYENNKINRMNIMEVTKDKVSFILKSQEPGEDSTEVTYNKYDVYDDIISKLNDIINKLNPLLAEDQKLSKVTGTSVAPVVEDLTSLTSTSMISTLPGYDNAGYVKTADLIVYDPNKVIPQSSYYDE